MGRILLISEVFPPAKGGSGRWMWELYRRFPRGAVHAVASHGPGAAEFDRTDNVSIDRLTLKFPTWGVFGCVGVRAYAKALYALNAIVRRTRPQSVHCG